MDIKIEKLIEDIILKRTKEGYSTGGLVRYINEKYGLKESRAYDLIRIAREKVGEFYYKTNKNILEDAIERLEMMYKDSLKEKDKKLALQIQQELNKIQQLYIQKLDITSKGESININIS